jgi:hypothetical protein
VIQRRSGPRQQAGLMWLERPLLPMRSLMAVAALVEKRWPRVAGTYGRGKV